MSRRIISVRRGNSVQQRIQNPVQDIDALRLIPATDVVDKAIILVEDAAALYRYDYHGTGVDDGVTIIEPTVGTGRWFLLAGGGGSGAALDIDQVDFDFPPIHSKSLQQMQRAQDDLSIVDIILWMPSTPTSAGIYDLKVRGAGNDLLNVVPEDLKSYAGATFHSLPLTTVDPAFLDLAVGAPIEVEVESDDSDLVAKGVRIFIVYTTDAAGLPPFSGQQYSVLMEDPASTPVWQCLRQSWVCDDFTIDSFSGPGLLEVGDTLLNPGFTASYAYTPDTVKVQDDQGGSLQDFTGTPGAFNYLDTYTKNLYGDTVVWNMSADDSIQADTAQASTQWVQRLCYGPSVTGTIDEAFIEALANNPLATTKSRTFAVTAGAGEYIWYCFRSAYGAATFFVGGFEGGFSKVATVSVMNAFGFSENYDVYRSDNVALGTTTVEVV